MIFNEEELLAVAKLGIMMIEADFVTLQSETDKLTNSINLIGDDGINADDIMERARKLNHINMINSISNLDNDKKIITSAILMDIMNADESIESEEISMLNFASDVCHLPYVPIEEAKKILNNL